MEEKKIIQKDKKKLAIVIVILAVIILGIGVYIAYNKDIIFSPSEEETKGPNNSKEELDPDGKNEDSSGIKELDISKCLNSKNNNTYMNPSDVEGNYGLSMKINSDQKSIILSIDWEIFGPLSSASAWPSAVETYQITGFSKNISNVFVGDLGQSAVGITLFYLMSDGTVEYTPMFNQEIDSQNNSYYIMNYTYDYSPEGKITGQHFSTKGTIKDVNDVIKLYNADVSNNTSGWRTTIGAKKDGSFYDLGSII